MGTAYKYYGIGHDKIGPDPNITGNDRGTFSEYNSQGFYYQPRFNDVYIYCPPFGDDVSNSVIWTPSIRRDDPYTEVTKANYMVFDIEEFLGLTGTMLPYTTLEAQGITMYVKFKNENSLEFPEIRDDIVTPNIAVKRTTGVCAATGNIVQTGIGNTFGWTLGWAMCLGLRMDKPYGPNTTTSGRYYYYLVNRNIGNEKEIIWRICFIVGANNIGQIQAQSTSGTTMPFGTYVQVNPYRADPTIAIRIPTPQFPGGTGFTLSAPVSDEVVTNASAFPSGKGALAIEYNTMFGFTYPTYPSGQTWGTDNPNVQYPVLDPDYRPYTVNSVPIL